MYLLLELHVSLTHLPFTWWQKQESKEFLGSYKTLKKGYRLEWFDIFLHHTLKSNIQLFKYYIFGVSDTPGWLCHPVCSHLFSYPLGASELKTPYTNKTIKKYSLQYLKEKLQYLKEPTKISPFYDTNHRMGKHLINI